MSVIPTVKNKEISIQRFIDWDKFENIFYNNVYIENYKIVIKMNLIDRDNSEKDIKIKKFDLEKYTYLCSY
ncbi:hypothetical protein LCGC14_0490580 [marine sediment metagenome]|uniref:Uncharacterized protein n=1 Tax=marine sediment metagenome TaxID=412755 RepID=A0A0F9SQ22_9ZZZZ|nr:MAG: hypothetical protein Lokiarch_09400 [Candidatus Lokiarchaeum sp. GC14_75]